MDGEHFSDFLVWIRDLPGKKISDTSQQILSVKCIKIPVATFYNSTCHIAKLSGRELDTQGIPSWRSLEATPEFNVLLR